MKNQEPKYPSELKKIQACVDADVWDMLADLGCFIAGGALTSVFTNKEINDIDVYFPSKEAFTKAVQHIMQVQEYEYEWWIGGNSKKPTGFIEEYDISSYALITSVVTKKAILFHKGENKVQFIAHRFYNSPQEIFNDFDFTVNMAAYEMKTGKFILHDDFLKHCSQRYLSFNENTSYPLVSALRVKKYTDRGYTISKAQYLKICLAVNNKNIDSWEKLFDELGGMYGTPPEEIFDTTQPFSLEVAMQKLDDVVISETVKNNTNHTMKSIVKTMPHAFTDQVVSLYVKPDEVVSPSTERGLFIEEGF